MDEPVPVVAGLLERDGRLLICQRSPNGRHPLKWEFPGGKVEPGELPAQALARELEEELGIRARIGEEIVRYEHRYPDRGAVLLIFFRVAAFDPEPVNRVFADLRWEQPERLPDYDFIQGDLEFVRRLAPAP